MYIFRHSVLLPFPANFVDTVKSRTLVESIWLMMAQGDACLANIRGNWGMEWVASTPHTTSENRVSNITTADAHSSAASI